MAQRALVPVLRVRDPFHARVVVARLGSEGILAQLRGADGPYPMGIVEVLVLPDELADAQELLLADEIESAFASDHATDPGGGDGGAALPRWAVALTLVLLVLFALSHAVAGG